MEPQDDTGDVDSPICYIDALCRAPAAWFVSDPFRNTLKQRETKAAVGKRVHWFGPLLIQTDMATRDEDVLAFLWLAVMLPMVMAIVGALFFFLVEIIKSVAPALCAPAFSLFVPFAHVHVFLLSRVLLAETEQWSATTCPSDVDQRRRQIRAFSPTKARSPIKVL